MALQDDGDVPFWITPQERVVTKFSQCYEPQLKDKTEAELIGDIKSAGIDISIVKGNRVGQLQDVSHEKTIYVTKRIMKESVKVWMGKPKWILQVLWERIFMDTSKDVCTYYTIRGQEDNYFNNILETGLR